MRVMIPVSDGLVSQLDGSCQQLFLADLDDGKVAARSYLDNPGHGPSGPPASFLIRLGVDKVIAGGSPDDPVTREMQSQGISVIQGACGSPEQVLQDYVSGDLQLKDPKIH